MYFLIISYPKAYQEEFIRDLFFAANTFHVALSSKQKTARDAVAAATSGSHTQTGLRPRLTLEEEQRINQNADCRIIGLTLVRFIFLKETYLI